MRDLPGAWIWASSVDVRRRNRKYPLLSHAQVEEIGQNLYRRSDGVRTKEEGGCNQSEGTRAMGANSTQRGRGHSSAKNKEKKKVLWEKREQEDEAEGIKGNRSRE